MIKTGKKQLTSFNQNTGNTEGNIFEVSLENNKT